ncbi:MAG: universal stress protein, partial [Dehalococcoidia bacterium]|nr:universal stress protein [Dehalococcoidia bacterium]
GGRTIIREGMPRSMILDVAREVGADLIVMGTHGRTGLTHVFFGSVAEHVVRHSRIAVLTVRQRTE